MLNNSAGERLGYHQEKQPADTVPGQAKDIRVQVGFLRRFHSRHDLKVFGSLLLNDIHNVINRNDTDKPLFRIDNRQRQKTVPLKKGSRSLLIVMRIYIDTVAFANTGNQFLFLRQYQFF